MSAEKTKAWQQSYMQPERQQETKVKVKVKKMPWVTKGEKLLYSIVGAGLLAAGLYIVSFASSTDSINRDVQELENLVSNQQVTNENLLFEVKELSRPERIIEIAKENGLSAKNADVKQVEGLQE